MADEPIRVLVVGLSPLARETVEAALRADERIEVFAQGADVVLPEAIRAARADFVLIPLERSELPVEARRFLNVHAHVRVLGLEEETGRVNLYELISETVELGQLTPEELAKVVRDTAERRL